MRRFLALSAVVLSAFLFSSPANADLNLGSISRVLDKLHRRDDNSISTVESPSPAEPLATPPWFCHDLDCPTYESNSSRLFEVRTYPAYRWASVTMQGRDFFLAQNINALRLYAYFMGANSAKKAIPMTTPVATFVTPGLAINNYTTAFFLPYAMQGNGAAPTPNDPKIEFYESPANATVAVRSFSGYATTDRSLDQLLMLQQIMDDNNVQYNPHHFLVNVYDPPSTTTNRHNEVWLLMTNETQIEALKMQQESDNVDYEVATIRPYDNEEEDEDEDDASPPVMLKNFMY